MPGVNGRATMRPTGKWARTTSAGWIMPRTGRLGTRLSPCGSTDMSTIRAICKYGEMVDISVLPQGLGHARRTQLSTMVRFSGSRSWRGGFTPRGVTSSCTDRTNGINYIEKEGFRFLDDPPPHTHPTHTQARMGGKGMLPRRSR
jgi:hypothetical protein